ncbi:MAG: penicillin-binding protein 2 [Gallionellales bacterium RIFCSPLOWO2_12_FULL_57_18]|nr:MAG: penicillin-binding protein 2 [Gallionellales bacterium RIFCSPLOWO2_12_FULL_57_18]OGS97226.1 MAG: penicillin-binding protein 2 [Gallionellales bacterium RIFCSPLOWO2_02_FULL_57_47]OGT16013.1 MAG: penicillin-binding protein 2 [Gallionellales bacterium RIFCSPHIGHO2_02_FULL_57_16]
MNKQVEFKNHQREIFHFQLRLVVSIGFVLVLLAILLIRFVYLQAVRHSYYQTLAESNRIFIVPIVPNRGLILDRNGVELARNFSGYTLEIKPNQTADVEATINELSTLIEVTQKDRKRFKKQLAESRNFETLMIRSRLSDEEAARFVAQQYRFPGVEIKARLFRDYPFGEKTAHLIGYIGRINQTDMKLLEDSDLASNYRGSDYIGKTGLEQSYESELHGTTGIEQVEVDAGGRAVRMLSSVAPVSGNTLVLSIDVKLQEIAEQSFGDYRGALVAIDPNNGDVLAFVSKPGYDPNPFIDGIDTQSWDELNNSPDVPLNNRALRGQYPPGSTIKPFMALAGLNFNTRTPEETISDQGVFYLPGSSRQYRDWKVGGHGSVNMFKAITVSCDTYFYGLATELGIDNIFNYLSRFGFGKKTGIDLEGETPGLLPSQEWKMKRYQQIWYPGDTVSVGIGQGYNLVTPLQLAFATATLANNGVAYKPHLVKEVRSLRSSENRFIAKDPIYGLNIDPAHLDLVKRAMVAVTQPGGTAVYASLGTPYHIAGKTGTAQVIAMKQGEKYDADKIDERHRDHAWFIAFAPAEQPKIALVVLVENGGHGGSTAAPIARKVLDYYLLGKVPKPLAVAEVKEAGEHD